MRNLLASLCTSNRLGFALLILCALIPFSCNRYDEDPRIVETVETRLDLRSNQGPTTRFTIVPRASRVLLGHRGEVKGQFEPINGFLLTRNQRIVGSGTNFILNHSAYSGEEGGWPTLAEAGVSQLTFLLHDIVNESGKLKVRGSLQWKGGSLQIQGPVDRAQITPDKAIFFARLGIDPSQVPMFRDLPDQPGRIDLIFRMVGRIHKPTASS